MLKRLRVSRVGKQKKRQRENGNSKFEICTHISVLGHRIKQIKRDNKQVPCSSQRFSDSDKEPQRPFCSFDGKCIDWVILRQS